MVGVLADSVLRGRSAAELVALLETVLPAMLAARPAPGADRRGRAVADIRCHVHALRWARSRTMPGELWDGASWVESWRSHRCSAAPCGRRAAELGGLCRHHERAEACRDYGACDRGGDPCCLVCGDRWPSWDGAAPGPIE